MAFDWNNYLSIAKDFESKSISETDTSLKETLQRVALSRAYYSMYHLAVGYAKIHLNYVPSSCGSNQYHSDIQGVYRRQYANVQHQEIKQILFRMNVARKKADYEPESIGDIESLLRSIILSADEMEGILSR